MISEALWTRLDLLRKSGQIDDDVATFVAGWLLGAANTLAVPASEANFATLCTHTALALQRARRGEAIEQWAADHSGELQDAPRARALADDFALQARERLGIEIPNQERDFVALHLAAATLRTARA